MPLTDLPLADLRRRVALVTQEHHVFLGSVRDNLAFAAPDATDDDMRAALATVGADWFDALPDGLDTELGDGARAVAGRRAAARAGPAGARRPAHADPGRGDAALDPTTARRTERALAAVLTAARSSRSRTGSTPRTTPTGSRSWRTAGSPNSAATTNSSPPAAPTPRSGAPGTAPTASPPPTSADPGPPPGRPPVSGSVGQWKAA